MDWHLHFQQIQSGKLLKLMMYGKKRKIMAKSLWEQQEPHAFVFLASDEASYITGVILSVDGMARS